MSFFKNLFGNEEQQRNSLKIEWNPLTDIKQLDAIVEESNSQPIVIFKHSTRCNISRMVLKQFENEFDVVSGLVKPYYLDLLEFRPISNEIAAKFNVVHQSPQIIVLKNELVVHDASHSDIQAGDLRNV
ncbi:bacillithiol system redox-active protein YtxJ [Flavobacterium sp. GCM10027622]|uniref:bacillithiol system redox-active protein YtxJ n=1 Tax=unclassified Flavobacterium TaxID=196869 RepID=UPI0036127639